MICVIRSDSNWVNHQSSLTLGRVELDAVLLAPAGMVNIGRGGGDHPVVVVDLL